LTEKQKKRNVTETKVVINVIGRKSCEPDKSRPTNVRAGIPMKKVNLIQLVRTTPQPNELNRGEPAFVNIGYHNMAVLHC